MSGPAPIVPGLYPLPAELPAVRVVTVVNSAQVIAATHAAAGPVLVVDSARPIHHPGLNPFLLANRVAIAPLGTLPAAAAGAGALPAPAGSATTGSASYGFYRRRVRPQAPTHLPAGVDAPKR